jgi:hypothetical protein
MSSTKAPNVRSVSAAGRHAARDLCEIDVTPDGQRPRVVRGGVDVHDATCSLVSASAWFAPRSRSRRRHSR